MSDKYTYSYQVGTPELPLGTPENSNPATSLATNNTNSSVINTNHASNNSLKYQAKVYPLSIHQELQDDDGDIEILISSHTKSDHITSFITSHANPSVEKPKEESKSKQKRMLHELSDYLNANQNSNSQHSHQKFTNLQQEISYFQNYHTNEIRVTDYEKSMPWYVEKKDISKAQQDKLDLEYIFGDSDDEKKKKKNKERYLKRKQQLEANVEGRNDVVEKTVKGKKVAKSNVTSSTCDDNYRQYASSGTQHQSNINKNSTRNSNSNGTHSTNGGVSGNVRIPQHALLFNTTTHNHHHAQSQRSHHTHHTSLNSHHSVHSSDDMASNWTKAEEAKLLSEVMKHTSSHSNTAIHWSSIVNSGQFLGRTKEELQEKYSLLIQEFLQHKNNHKK